MVDYAPNNEEVSTTKHAHTQPVWVVGVWSLLSDLFLICFSPALKMDTVECQFFWQFRNIGMLFFPAAIALTILN